MRALPLLLALLLVPLAAAQSSEQGQGTVTLDGDKILHPAPTSLAKGDGIAFDWQVTEPAGTELYFSTHIHIGATLVNLTEDRLPSKVGKMVADRDGLYSLLWHNQGGAPVTFRFQYQAEHAPPAAAKAPLPEALAVLALGLGAVLTRARRGA